MRCDAMRCAAPLQSRKDATVVTNLANLLFGRKELLSLNKVTA